MLVSASVGGGREGIVHVAYNQQPEQIEDETSYISVSAKPNLNLPNPTQ